MSFAHEPFASSTNDGWRDTSARWDLQDGTRMMDARGRRAFSLKPFIASSNAIGLLQTLNTIGPYALLWFLAYRLAPISPWLLVPVVVLMILFSLRSFALMHDCGHFTLFRSVALNRCIGFLIGVLHGIPQYPWSRGHAYHHKHNGNWEVYRGPIGILSTVQFAQLSPRKQRLHVLSRHPLMLLPAGFFYLIIKPRLQIILGSALFLPHLVSCVRRRQARAIFSYRSKFWYTAGEFWHILSTNICVIGMWCLLGHVIGQALFWTLLSIVASCSAAIFLLVFFVQHQFDTSYASGSEGWDVFAGALEGTSFLHLPPILNWFTADIGYHNIHHLSDRIPNYRLAACHRANAHLLSEVKTLRIRDLSGCFDYILWNPHRNRLQTPAEFLGETRSGASSHGVVDRLHSEGVG